MDKRVRRLARGVALLFLLAVVAGGTYLVYRTSSERLSPTPPVERHGEVLGRLEERAQEFLRSLRGGEGRGPSDLRGPAPRSAEAPPVTYAEAPPDFELDRFGGLSAESRRTPRLHFNLGLIHAQRGETTAAILNFERVIEVDAQGPYARRAYINLGVLLDRDGKPEAALRYLRKAMVLDPEDAFAHHVAGLAQLHRGAREEAVATLERAAALDPTSAEILQNLTVAYEAADDLAGAEEAARRAVEVAPERGVLHLNLGLVLWRRGKLPEAAEALAAARERLSGGEAVEAALYAGRIAFARGLFEEAARAFAAATDAAPGRADAWFNLGIARAKAGNGAASAEALRRTLSLAPGDTEARFNLGAALILAGDYAGARRAYEEGLALADSVPTAHFMAGYLALRLGDRAAAKRHFERTIELGGPEAGRAQVNLGLLAEAAGDLEEAIRRYRQGDPEDPTTFYNLGLVLQRVGDISGAVEALKKAHALSQEDAKIAVALGDALLSAGHLEEAGSAYRNALRLKETPEVLLRLGHIERRLGQTASAEAHFARGLEVATSRRVRSDLLVERAVLRASTDRVDAAVADLQEAGRVDPTNGEVYYNLGVLAARDEKYDEAVAAFRSAIRLLPDDPRPYAALGDVYYRRGLLEEARQMYERATEVDSRAVEARWRIVEIDRAETVPPRPTFGPYR